MKDNDRLDTDMNEILQNGDVSSEVGCLYSHTLPQGNKSSKLNEMNIIVKVVMPMVNIVL